MLKKPAVSIKFVLSVMFVGVVRIASLPVSGQELPATWQAGVARTDITPTDSLWMAGYGARDHPGEGTTPPLWAKALVLQDAAGRQGVIVTSDLLRFPRGDIRPYPESHREAARINPCPDHSEQFPYWVLSYICEGGFSFNLNNS